VISIDNYIIDKIRDEDALSIYELMNNNAIRFQRFFPKTLAQNLTYEDSKKFALLKSQEHDSKLEFTFVLKDQNPNKIIGLIILKELDWDKKQGEFAYCIDAGYEGKGVMSKAVKEMSRYALDKLQLRTLQIVVHESNTGSAKVALNCSYKWHKTLLNEYTPPNEPQLDMELYELKK
jgi:ribosomal-protein-alanine N-acetyltransferase